MRGEQGDRVGLRRPVGQRAAGKLLVGEVLDERRDARSGEPVGVARGGVEQGEDRVEVTVGGGTDRAAQRARSRPPLLEARRLPDPPQHLLGALAVADRGAGDGEQLADAPQRGGLVGGERGERVGLPAGGRTQRVDEQGVAAQALLVRGVVPACRRFARRGRAGRHRIGRSGIGPAGRVQPQEAAT